MKAVQLLVNSVLPEDLRNYEQVYDEKGINKILYAVAKKYPDKFADISHKLSDIGRNASWDQGLTISLKDLAPVIDKKAIFAEMDAEVAKLPKDANFEDEKQKIFQKYNDRIETETLESALKNRNNIALSVLSGARGKKAQAKAMLSTPGTYSDSKGKVTKYFTRESFSEGLRPASFLASTPGARASVISTKVSTAKGGDWAKQAASVAADMVVRKGDCGTGNGIALDIDDNSLRGRVLSSKVAGFEAGTFVTRDVLSKIRKSGEKSVLVRSPITCQCSNGLCAHCVGKFYNGGKLPKVGDSIGLLASSTVSEPVTQMALCLAKGTMVRMADFSVKAIEDIVTGDIVLGADIEANTFPVEVTDTFVQGIKEVNLYIISVEDGEGWYRYRGVLATKDHKVLTLPSTPGEFGVVRTLEECLDRVPLHTIIACKELENNKKGDGHILTTIEMDPAECFDIEVNHPDHLFVLENGLIVSNSAKHTAGMTSGKKSYSGLSYIQQFSQSPEHFKDKAALAELDGKITDVREAAQGGSYVYQGDKKYYVPMGHEVLVKPGDSVEAGDQLADGLVDPEDVVRHKGIGEGRLYYANRLNQMLADSGAGTDKRNTEVLARAALRHVQITNPEGMGNYLPDDMADYDAIQSSYTPPETAVKTTPKNAVGKYLQSPALHYTVGTRITSKVADNLAKNKFDSILVDDSSPGFEPTMVRLRTASHTNPDWLASMGTSYLGKQLEEASIRGEDTNIESNPDFRPRLAVGVGFGENVEKTGEF